jgi:hypothetical protein
MRDKVYSFAGCILDGAPFVDPLPPAGNNAFGMSSEGILRLMAGNTLSIDPPQLAQLRAADPALSEASGRYDPINPATIKALLWTPVNDAIYLFPNARCPDKTSYPIYNGAVDTILGTTGASMSRAMIFALWDRLLQATASIPFKAILSYPTTHLASSAWKERLDKLDELACLNFDSWHEFTIRAEPEAGVTYWAHYSETARRELWDSIGKKLAEVTP